MDEELRKIFLKSTFNSIGKGYNNAPLSFFIDSAQDNP